MNQTESIDGPHSLWEATLELACGDHATAERLLEMILQTNRSTLGSLRESFKAACWDSVASSAHRIAGSARMLKCDDLIAQLTQLETAARGRDIALATALLPSLIDAIEELDVAIAKTLDSDG
ncbi:Hpt domain-containing protein [Paraburkholderia phytofirmans]|uniref:Hpt domain-containing protein n=1 Tax=Paraburkholderia phytofirmans TaxID=261302 RepID=UPI0038BDE289